MRDFRFFGREFQSPLSQKRLYQRNNMVGNGLFVNGRNYESSQPGELPPELLTAPDVNLSAHPAPIVQSKA